MIPTTGTVTIDGVKTEDINLHALRSNVTIIPQDPVSLACYDARVSDDPPRSFFLAASDSTS
jgi:ABC-type transport system involved in Fe-S cluster assembly fused permease/ATPase subunit